MSVLYDVARLRLNRSVIRHEDVLQNLEIPGQDFSQQNEPLVREVTRKFLEYVKSARVEANNSRDGNPSGGESESAKIQMTPDGYPIVPQVVMEKQLRKSEWERLLRAYLAQHYCE